MRCATRSSQADINPIQVKGLGFDATCSLVVLDKEASR